MSRCVDEWEALHGTSLKLAALVQNALLDQGHPQPVSRKRMDSVPDIQLLAGIPNLRNDLARIDIGEDRVERCASMYETSLRALGQELQKSFEDTWCNLLDDPSIPKQTQAALIQLYERRFLEEIDSRRTIIFQLVSEQTKDDIEQSGEWTDETRALMERVYQQHPKLEAREKKVLSEVSGLSLRQISIWVSSCTASFISR